MARHPRPLYSAKHTAISAFGWFCLSVFVFFTGGFVAAWAVWTGDLLCLSGAFLVMALAALFAGRTVKWWW